MEEFLRKYRTNYKTAYQVLKDYPRQKRVSKRQQEIIDSLNNYWIDKIKSIIENNSPHWWGWKKVIDETWIAKTSLLLHVYWIKQKYKPFKKPVRDW